MKKELEVKGETIVYPMLVDEMTLAWANGKKANPDQSFNDILTGLRLAEEVLHKSKKAKKGTVTSQKTFKEYVAVALYLLGGTASMQDCIKKIEKQFSHLFKDVDYHNITQDRIRWIVAAQWARTHMGKVQLVSNNAARGTWSLTNQGAAYAETLLDKYHDCLGDG